MKTNYLLLALLLLSFTTATAQTEKGRWMVGTQVGGVTYLSQGEGSYKTFSASLMPSAGLFVVDNLLIGTGVPLSLSGSKSGTSTLNSNTTVVSLGLSPFVRYFFGKSVIKPYVGVGYGYTYSKSTFKTLFGTVSGDGNSTTLTPTAGVSYFINRNIALNAGLTYNVQSGKSAYLNFSSSAQRPTPTVVELESSYNSLSFGVGFQLFLGR